MTSDSNKILALNGEYTKSRLVKKGISESSIATALKVGLLKYKHTGVIETIPKFRRNTKLAEAESINPGMAVGYLDKESNNTLKHRQVVKDDGDGNVWVIDPENPAAAPIKVRKDSLALSDESSEDTSNTTASAVTPI